MANQYFVNALPTKEFFVEMLTKDVRLPMAILDLIDNSVDGALRLRGPASFNGLEVNVTFDQDHFEIRDNCGGISLDTALNYAFRFGRPKEVEAVPNSVGRFGVGMKRALFKIGRYFEIATQTADESFRIVGDVDDWLRKDKWEFPVEDYQSHNPAIDQGSTGTTILVTRLTEETKRWFSLPQSESSLKSNISTYHQQYIDRNMVMALNDLAIPTTHLEFLVSASPLLQPFYRQYLRDDVRIRLLAGVGQSIPNEAGWYVYCNGRKVLDADRSRITGWGEPNMTPRFHNQYARFRGVAFFDSADPALLPWNTTKDGVDEGSPVFSETYRLMVEAMKPVLRFLDRVDGENSAPEGWRALTELLDERAQVQPISSLRPSDSFVYKPPPTPLGPPPERTISIQYRKPVKLVDAVKRSLGASTARQAGEETFDYYVTQEAIDAC